MIDLKTIAEKFNKFFTDIGPNLAKDIDPSSVTFDNYLKTFNANQPEHTLTANELNGVFFSLKINKSPGYEYISFNVIKTCLVLCISHYFIFLTNPCNTEFFQVSWKF